MSLCLRINTTGPSGTIRSSRARRRIMANQDRSDSPCLRFPSTRQKDKSRGSLIAGQKGPGLQGIRCLPRKVGPCEDFILLIGLEMDLLFSGEDDFGCDIVLPKGTQRMPPVGPWRYQPYLHQINIKLYRARIISAPRSPKTNLPESVAYLLKRFMTSELSRTSDNSALSSNSYSRI